MRLDLTRLGLSNDIKLCSNKLFTYLIQTQFIIWMT